MYGRYPNGPRFNEPSSPRLKIIPLNTESKSKAVSAKAGRKTYQCTSGVSVYMVNATIKGVALYRNAIRTSLTPVNIPILSNENSENTIREKINKPRIKAYIRSFVLLSKYTVVLSRIAKAISISTFAQFCVIKSLIILRNPL